MPQDPQQLINDSPMSRLQIAAVTICVILNALDGFDVLAISFAAPGIAEEWGVNRGALGVVLAMELIGMALGSILLGNLADRFGRRYTVMGCLIGMSLGMYLAALSNSLNMLMLLRFLTGLGIGGMLATINAMAAEHSSTRRRNFTVSCMATGYPLGVIAGGTVASYLLAKSDWRAVFEFGAVFTAAMLPFAWFLLPESVAYLLQRRPPDALERINKNLRRMGHQPVTALPAETPRPERAAWTELFAPGLLRTTVLLTACYFGHIMTFYFIIKWIPKLVVDMGFAASSAGTVLVWANVGGAAGAVLLSILCVKMDVRRLVIGAMLAATVMVNVFGQGQADLAGLALIAATVGFFTNSAIVGLYAIFAQSFPTRVRAGGTGFVIGVGRGGAALGPILAGFLFEGGQGLATVALVMGMGSLVGAVMLLLLRNREPAL